MRCWQCIVWVIKTLASYFMFSGFLLHLHIYNIINKLCFIPLLKQIEEKELFLNYTQE